MKITIQDAGQHTAAGPAAGERSGLNHYLAWMRALESAQWNERLRYQSPIDRPISPTVEADAGDGESRAARDAEMPEIPESADTHRTVTDETKQPVRTPAGASRETGAAAPLARRVQPAASGVGSLSGLVAYLPVGSPDSPKDGDATATSQQTYRGESSQWQVEHVHVTLDGVRLNVWLRDARLDAGAGLRLLSSLRRQLRGMGLELGGLALNGNPVGASTPATQ